MQCYSCEQSLTRQISSRIIVHVQSVALKFLSGHQRRTKMSTSAQSWGCWVDEIPCTHNKDCWRAKSMDIQSCFMAGPVTTVVGTVAMHLPGLSFLPIESVNVQLWDGNPSYKMNQNEEVENVTTLCLGRFNSPGFRNLADGKGSLTHDYVKISFECQRCGRNNVYTYDLGSEGKRCRSGKYTAVSHCKRGISGHLNLDFETCKKIFDGMWQGWRPTSTCGTWASDFYEEAMIENDVGGNMGRSRAKEILDRECSEFSPMTVSRAREIMDRECLEFSPMTVSRARGIMGRLDCSEFSP